MAGMDSAVIAGGVHSSSTSPRSKKRIVGTTDWVDWMSLSHPDSAEAPAFDMSITVGWNTAKIAGISREEMDAWALRSHQRAIAAIDEGRFAKEIVPIKVTTSDGSAVVFEVDEHPRRGTSHGEAGRPEGPAPRDRGLLDHGGQRLGHQRRGVGRWCSPRTASPPSTAWPRWPRCARGPRSGSTPTTRASRRPWPSPRRSAGPG